MIARICIYKNRCRNKILFLLATLLLLSSGSSFGASCSGGSQTFTLTLPSTVSVPRDAPVGSLLTAWVDSAAATNLWTCTNTAGTLGVIAYAGPLFTTKTGQNYSSGGVSYTVYQTNVAGVGIVVAGRQYTPNAGWSGWGNPPLGTAYGPVTATWTMGAQVSVALVKTGTVSMGGVVSSGSVIHVEPAGGYGDPYADYYAITPVTVVPLTCTTPDVSIPMGTFKTTDFPSVGSLSPNPAAFTIQLLNCPAGTAVSGTQAGLIHSIQYRIDPTNGTLATNVAALSGSPSASGVGIQLFNSSGAVFPLSTNTTLSGYNSTAGGDYSISMTARYYRTGTVAAGPANTTMTLSMTYQ